MDKEQLQTNLLAWYDTHKRDLPWRKTHDPYAIWVSEMMLQQTRVDTVIAYYHRFLSALPTVYDLADAHEDLLLKLWQGLGYYSRVKNMQKAAQMVVEKFGGHFPSEKKDLLTLPGIGDYSSGSVASIAFDIRTPAVDGNVLRVFSRLLLSYDDIAKPETKKKLTKVVTQLLPQKRVGDFNQAIMELGACICLPNGAPLCKQCPLKDLCKANQNHLQTQVPVKSKPAARTVEEKTVLLLEKDNEYLIQKRPSTGLLARLWEFPNEPGHLSKTDVEKWLQEKGFEFSEILPLPSAKHIFTHKEWHMTGYVIHLKTVVPEKTFASAQQLTKIYSVPTAFETFLKFICR